jgi:hypothetical protein
LAPCHTLLGLRSRAIRHVDASATYDVVELLVGESGNVDRLGHLLFLTHGWAHLLPIFGTDGVADPPPERRYG